MSKLTKNIQKLSVVSVAVAASSAALAEVVVPPIDVSPVVNTINALMTPISLLGASVLLVYCGLKGWKLMSGALKTL